MSSSSSNRSQPGSDKSRSVSSGGGRTVDQSESQSSTRVYLRGVDLPSLVERYLNNEFAGLLDPIPVEPTAMADIGSGEQSIITVRDDTKAKSYQLDLGAGQIFTCIGYKVYDADGHYGVFDPNVISGYRCMFCLRKIGQSREAMGIPISREDRREDQIYYHMVDIFCRFRCVYAELRRRRGNQLYAHSMEYLAEIYTKSTGNSITDLKPSSDPRLLKILNGPMTWEEYHSDSTTFSEKPSNIFYVPVIEYVEQDPQGSSASS